MYNHIGSQPHRHSASGAIYEHHHPLINFTIDAIISNIIRRTIRWWIMYINHSGCHGGGCRTRSRHFLTKVEYFRTTTVRPRFRKLYELVVLFLIVQKGLFSPAYIQSYWPFLPFRKASLIYTTGQKHSYLNTTWNGPGFLISNLLGPHCLSWH